MFRNSAIFHIFLLTDFQSPFLVFQFLDHVSSVQEASRQDISSWSIYCSSHTDVSTFIDRASLPSSPPSTPGLANPVGSPQEPQGFRPPNSRWLLDRPRPRTTRTFTVPEVVLRSGFDFLESSRDVFSRRDQDNPADRGSSHIDRLKCVTGRYV